MIASPFAALVPNWDFFAARWLAHDNANACSPIGASSFPQGPACPVSKYGIDVLTRRGLYLLWNVSPIGAARDLLGERLSRLNQLIKKALTTFWESLNLTYKPRWRPTVSTARLSTKSCLFAAIAVVALALSAAAAPGPAPSMGIVLQADNANLSGSPVVNGATIFSGDTLMTETSGALRARFGSAQIYLFPNSNVGISQTPKGFSANLTSGSVLLSSGSGQTYQVISDGAVIQPKGDQPSVAQVSWVSPTELMLTSRHGDLEVTMGDETQTIAEGSSFRMMITPASQPAAAAASPMPALTSGTNRFYLVAVVLIAVGTGIAIWRAYESTPATN
jgi:hypothetical protein